MNVNIVKNKNVETKVTVHLKDISVIDAFRILCRTHNLNYQAEKRLIQIYNQKDMLKDGGLSSGDIKIYNLKYAKAENVYKKMIEMGASDGKNEEYGAPAVYMNDKLNTIILVGRTDFNNMDTFASLISQLDKPTPQVLIEAKILEVTLTKSSSTGIKWNAIFQGANVNVNAPGVAGNTFTVSDLEYIIPNISISAVVNAIASTSDLQTLSSPRILCMNNEEAKIIEGGNSPYTEVSRDNLGNTTTSWKYVETGVGMTIKPLVFSNSIQLTIAPEISSAGSPPGQGAAPPITKSQLNTVVNVKDGCTLVLGGLIKTTKSKSSSGIPFLHSIPILGYLFGAKDVSDVRSEIVFLITPTIVRP